MAKTVKIVLLKDGTKLGKAGDTVEVTEEVANVMCTYRELHNGVTFVKYRSARPADEAPPAVNPALMTAAQMAAAGKKNVVETPAAFQQGAVEAAAKAKAAADKAVSKKA